MSGVQDARCGHPMRVPIGAELGESIATTAGATTKDTGITRVPGAPWRPRRRSPSRPRPCLWSLQARSRLRVLEDGPISHPATIMTRIVTKKRLGLSRSLCLSWLLCFGRYCIERTAEVALAETETRAWIIRDTDADGVHSRRGIAVRTGFRLEA